MEEPPIIIDHGEAAQARERKRLAGVIAANVQARAKTLQLNRAQLAKRAGITWNNLDATWRGTVEPRLSTLQRIAEALGCTVADLLKAE